MLLCAPCAQTTALFYFKRFFLCVNVLDADPFRVLATCIFLAGKVRSLAQGSPALLCDTFRSTFCAELYERPTGRQAVRT